jgi:hypothetical protein
MASKNFAMPDLLAFFVAEPADSLLVGTNFPG